MDEPTEPLLTWDFQNTVSRNTVSTSTAAAAHPDAVNGMATQTGGGPAEVWGATGTVFLTRHFGAHDAFLWIISARPLYLAALSFRHWHNHNPGFPTHNGYDVQLRLDSGAGYRDVGAPLRLDNSTSGQSDTIRIDETVPAGSHRISWHPRGLRGRDTWSEFFAVKDVVLTGRVLDAGAVPSAPVPRARRSRGRRPRGTT